MGSVSRSSNNIFQMPSWRSTKLMRCMKVHNNTIPQPSTFASSLRHNLHLPARKLRQFDGQKLTLDFPIAAGQMKSDIARAKEAPEKPWNLRARKAPEENSPNSVHAVVKPRAEVRSSSSRLLRGSGGAAVSHGGVAAAASTSSGVKRKFSISLSKEEIEEDFMAMTGHKLPRRPKKTPRSLLDPLFPGQWLAEIDVKVSDDRGNGKVNVR